MLQCLNPHQHLPVRVEIALFFLERPFALVLLGLVG